MVRDEHHFVISANVSTSGIVLTAAPPSDVDSMDVLINGHRVWSIDLLSVTRKPVTSTFPWPPALKPHLDGRALVEIRDSGTAQILWSGPAQFGTSQSSVEVVDALGRHLAINKWGRLGKTFDGSDSGFTTRLLDHTDTLVALLTELGLKPFVVGGTLLGAVRSGAMLPHDDDVDLAYLSDHQHPADVALENSRLATELTDRGYEVTKHSNAHLQLTFRADSGHVREYVDIFTAFYTVDGQINQPFHVRGELERSSMTPFSTVTLEGRPYPAPAIPEDWLVVNYDENWRTPLPGYKLRTPRSTARRFQSWFGSYHFQRDFWEGWHLDPAPSHPAPDLRAADRLLSLSTSGDVIIDLGCGTGAVSRHLAGAGRIIEAFDYSEGALSRARATPTGASGTIRWHQRNVSDLRDVVQILQVLAHAEQPVHLLAQNLFERLGHHGREAAWRIVRQVVQAGGTALLAVDTLHARDVTFKDPTTWHLSLPDLQTELDRFGLTIRTSEQLHGTKRDALRKPHLITIGQTTSQEGRNVS